MSRSLDTPATVTPARPSPGSSLSQRALLELHLELHLELVIQKQTSKSGQTVELATGKVTIGKRRGIDSHRRLKLVWLFSTKLAGNSPIFPLFPIVFDHHILVFFQLHTCRRSPVCHVHPKTRSEQTGPGRHRPNLGLEGRGDPCQQHKIESSRIDVSLQGQSLILQMSLRSRSVCPDAKSGPGRASSVLHPVQAAVHHLLQLVLDRPDVRPLHGRGDGVYVLLGSMNCHLLKHGLGGLGMSHATTMSQGR